MAAIGGAGQLPGGRGWPGEQAVIACVVVALVLLGLLHVRGIGAIDPRTDVLSDYVVLPGGYALLGVAALALAAAGLVIVGDRKSVV